VGNLGAILPFVLLAVIFWLLIVRPQRRRQQQLTATQHALEPGAEVMLGAGIFGTVTAVEDDSLRLEVAPGMTIKVARQAVVRRVDEPVDGSSAADTGTSDSSHDTVADPDDAAASADPELPLPRSSADAGADPVSDPPVPNERSRGV
jgi:preprotein translocase subunit YajC